MSLRLEKNKFAGKRWGLFGRGATIFSICVAALLTLVSFSVDDSDVNAKVKSLFLYQISKYVMWPEEMTPKDFKIAVYGDYPELISELQKMAAEKKRGDQSYSVENFKKVSDVKDCYMLYFAHGAEGDISKVMEKIKGRNVLVVTDNDGMIRKGACINFFYEENKQRFEISNENIKGQGLKISAKLSSMARVID